MAAPQFIHYFGLVQTPKSGAFEFAERIYYTEELQGTYADARSYGDNHHRSSIWTFTGLAGYFCVENASVASERGGIGTVTVKYVWLNSLPADEWSITPFEINPAIEGCNFFAALTLTDRKLAKASFNSDQLTGQATLDKAAAASANHVLIQSLITKWMKGEETFYMAGLKYQWTVFLTTTTGVILRRGGYIETPGGPGTIPPGFSWLRQCDEIVWNNGIYRITRTWVGAPIVSSDTFWDPDVYPTAPI